MASINYDQGFNLLKNPKFADMTIVCGDQSFRVHKVIVCSASPFFAKCFEGTFKEASEGSVTIGDTEPFILGVALVYVYTKAYNVHAVQRIWKEIKSPAEGLSHQCSSATQALHVYQVADRLLMPALRNAACDYFKQAIDYGYWCDKNGRLTELATLLQQVY